MAKVSYVPNFGSGRIRPTRCNQNVTDRNIRHKIYFSQLSNLLDLMRELNSSQIFVHAVCSSLRSTATRDFRPMIGRTDFARLAFVLLLTPLAIEEDCLVEAISCFKLLTVTGSRLRVIRIRIKTPLIFLVCIEITVKSVR